MASSIPAPPYELAEYEAGLAPLWRDPQPRMDFYTQLVVDHGFIRGRSSITEFLAAMARESGLNNMRLGDNHANGVPFTKVGAVTVGYSFIQFDDVTGFDLQDRLDIPWVPPKLRSSPLAALDYLAEIGTVSGLVEYQGDYATHFKKSRWFAWKPKLIDPNPGDSPDGFYPLREANAAWDRLYG